VIARTSLTFDALNRKAKLDGLALPIMRLLTGAYPDPLQADPNWAEGKRDYKPTGSCAVIHRRPGTPLGGQVRTLRAAAGPRYGHRVIR